MQAGYWLLVQKQRMKKTLRELGRQEYGLIKNKTVAN